MDESDPPQSVTEVLFSALGCIPKNQIPLFKLHLQDSTLLGHFKVISKSKLQTNNHSEILVVMTNSYGIFTIDVMKLVLDTMNYSYLAQTMYQHHYDPKVIIAEVRKNMTSNQSERVKFLSEGVGVSGEKIIDHYTELFITPGDSEQVNEEHEVWQMQRHSRRTAQERTILCQDIFKGTDQRGRPIRVVLTKGVAGVGKTVLTQKFSLDWAEGRAHRDIQMLFLFTFRELNKYKESELSLEELLHDCFEESKDISGFQYISVLFIFDGLDECRLPLDFRRTRVLTEPTEGASVEELLVNLIRGKLLPSARIWITTRPTAANQIPAQCISMVTEVRGFTDKQKEEYFRRRFRDEQQASTVISHIKKSPSLFIMCHIAIFCWILSDVLLKVMKIRQTIDLPTTLTQMYIHFLVVQAKVKSSKYEGRNETDSPWTPDTRQMVRSLGKLAFEQLLKGKLIFDESDLSNCGLDATEVARYSGVFTQVFREEPGQGKNKVYCFIHLSVQEFLAAFHVHQTFFSSGENLLPPPQSSDSENLPSPPQSSEHPDPDPTPEEVFYRSAVDQALQSPNGHLDLFLRFLLGLSLPTNQRLLNGLLTMTGSDQANPATVAYVKEKLNEKIVSAERSLNLLHCLNELNDHSLLQDIEKVMKEGELSNRHLSPAELSAVSFLLLSSGSTLEHFDLPQYSPSEEALLIMLPVIKVCTKATLSGCGLSSGGCGPLASVLGSSSSLTHLDLSNNHLQDSGVQLLCEGLRSAPCRLESLSLSLCGLSSGGCGPLASVLSSSSSLTQLDLSNNDLQDSGVELLCETLKSAPCRLESLSLSLCGLSSGCCGPLASVLGSSSSLTQLDLSNNDLQDSGVELLCETLKSAPCRLECLRLSGCLVTERGGASLATTLHSTPSSLRELDLSYNYPGASAELLIALRAPQGPLQTLRLDPAGERFMVPGLRKYACEFFLDPNTAQRHLHLSEDHRYVTCLSFRNHFSDHVDRFTGWVQVLSSTGLKGRCYWEVDWSGIFVGLGVTYRGISRSGMGWECLLGHNGLSWSLCINKGECYINHNQKTTTIPGTVGVPSGSVGLSSGTVGMLVEEDMSSGRVAVFLGEGVPSGRVAMFLVEEGMSSGEEDVSSGEEDVSSGRVAMFLVEEGMSSGEEGVSSGEEGVPSGRKAVFLAEEGMSSGEEGVSSDEEGMFSGRVGVFLDWEGGVLSFYDITDGGMSHIYTFNNSFTEELFPGFRLDMSMCSASVVNLTQVLNLD